MLENPWSDLEVNTNTDTSKAPSSADVSSVKLSDSMIPQVILINYLFGNLEALALLSVLHYKKIVKSIPAETVLIHSQCNPRLSLTYQSSIII